MRALRFVAKRLGVPMRTLAVVGDDPVVEVLMARRGGATALAVTTGTTHRAEWQRQPPSRRPDAVLADLRGVLDWVDETPDAPRSTILRSRATRSRVHTRRAAARTQSRSASKRRAVRPPG